MKLASCLLAALLAQLIHSSSVQAESTSRPNIILILADDLGYSDLGCYGGEIDTPNIDSLAAGGVKFTQLYNSARCCPSRASLISGLYPSQAGIGDFTTGKPSKDRGPGYLGRLNDQCVTMAEALKPAGYGCYYVGKWHMHPETGPIKRGFDEFYGYTNDHSHDQYDADYYFRLPAGREKEIDPPAGEYYATDVFNDYAIEFIKQGQKAEQPWFLFLGHSSPHFPVQAPPERADKYEATYLRGWDVLREERYERMKELGLVNGDQWDFTPRSLVPVDRDDIANGYSGQQNPAWDSLDQDRQHDLARRMAIFAAMVEGVDNGVGKIVDHLKSTQDFENTLILFLSDNGACYEWGPFGFDGRSRTGETILRTGKDLQQIGQRGTHQSYGSAWANLGNTPFRMYKHFTHEGGISTPFIAHWPQGIEARKDWERTPAHVMDLLPTLLDVTGATYPEEFNGNKITPVEGTSLLPAMKGHVLPARSIGFDHQAAHALREGDWKIVWSKRSPVELKWELYNLAKDRCEMHDLAEEFPERVKQMADRWEQWAWHVNVLWDNDEASNTSHAAPVEVESPHIQNRPLTITGHVVTDSKTGVIAAQGGVEQGYAVHLLNGKLAFDVRVNGKVSRIATDETVPVEFDFSATLDAESFLISFSPTGVAQGVSPGLIPSQPKDGLSIGFDDRSAAGNYQAPNPLNGVVSGIKVKAGKDRKALSLPPKKRLRSPRHSVIEIEDGITRLGEISKPLFADPNYNGSCDPEIIWNSAKQEWYIYYTARRATLDHASYVGTPIGVITSPDLVNWTFRGYCSFDGQGGMPDNADTHWAPGVIQFGNSEFHMFATYKDSVEPPWGGSGVIRHYVASMNNPVHGWKLVDVPKFNQPDPIDVSLLKIDDEYRAFYRVGKGGGIHWATSQNLSNWENQGSCPGEVNAKDRGYGYQEAPYVFHFGGKYWMLTDLHEGLAVFHSSDCIKWTQQARILQEPGKGKADSTLARHPSVAVVKDRAFIFYHTEPNRPYPTPPAEQRTPHQKVSFLQMAELKIEHGELVCHRNEEVYVMNPPKDNLLHSSSPFPDQ